MWDELILTTDEAYFLKAEANIPGFGMVPQSLYRSSIFNAKSLWELSENDIETFKGSGKQRWLTS